MEHGWQDEDNDDASVEDRKAWIWFLLITVIMVLVWVLPRLIYGR